MPQNKTLIKRLRRRGITLVFKDGQNRGCAFPKDERFIQNETFLASNIQQIKTITEEEWNKGETANSTQSY